MVAPTCFGITFPSSGSVPIALRDAQLRNSRQNIVDERVVSSGVVRGDLRIADRHAPRHYTAQLRTTIVSSLRHISPPRYNRLWCPPSVPF
jgi:hypothetical protein